MFAAIQQLRVVLSLRSSGRVGPATQIVGSGAIDEDGRSLLDLQNVRSLNGGIIFVRHIDDDVSVVFAHVLALLALDRGEQPVSERVHRTRSNLEAHLRSKVLGAHRASASVALASIPVDVHRRATLHDSSAALAHVFQWASGMGQWSRAEESLDVDNYVRICPAVKIVIL